jgi:regulator of PEP synthase PpsR (kinase-PPPase family)
MNEKHIVYFVSDRTGLTAESYGRSLLAQFPDLEFESRKIAFVDSESKARLAAGEIERARSNADTQVVVVSTLVEATIRDIVESTSACVINLFSAFIEPLEDCLGQNSAHTLGISKSIFGDTAYQHRIDAIEYSLAHDDGIRPDQYDQADAVLVGVSRCGKTPSSLYLALNFSIKVANYPLTEEDLGSEVLPACLRSVAQKLVGLMISPGQLSSIREQRRPGSDYASLTTCQSELRVADALFGMAGIPVFDTTDTSIEEIAGQVIKVMGLGRTSGE